MAVFEDIFSITLAAIPIFILLGLGMNEDTKASEPKKEAEDLLLLFPDDDDYDILLEERLEELNNLREVWFRFMVRSKFLRGLSHGLVFPFLLLTPMFFNADLSIPMAIPAFLVVFVLFAPVDIYLTSKRNNFWKEQADPLAHLIDILEQMVAQDEVMRGAYIDSEELDLQEYLTFEIINFIEDRGLVGAERTQILDYLTGLNSIFAESVVEVKRNYSDLDSL